MEIFLILASLFVIYQLHKASVHRALRVFRRSPKPKDRPDAQSYTPASPKLQRQLVELFDGDRQQAEDFVAQVRFGSYGKSEAYYWSLALQRKRYLDRAEREPQSAAAAFGSGGATKPSRDRRPPLATGSLEFDAPGKRESG